MIWCTIEEKGRERCDMIGEKIKSLRVENSLTQKELAEKLYVTAQAVSRWENNEVEPSISTLGEMAKVFNVSVSELLGEENSQKEVVVEKEIVYKEPKPVLAVCEHCNKPIYDGAEIVRNKRHYGDSTETQILCRDCDIQIKKERHEQAVQEGLRRRKNSFVWAGIFSGLIAIAALVIAILLHASPLVIALSAVGGLLFYPFLACLYLDNTFVADLVTAIASWTIRLPGLIFNLSLEGILWLLTVKLAMWVLGGILSFALLILAIVVGVIVSLFVYPYSIVKNIKHPEEEYLF